MDKRLKRNEGKFSMWKKREKVVKSGLESVGNVTKGKVGKFLTFLRQGGKNVFVKRQINLKIYYLSSKITRNFPTAHPVLTDLIVHA